MSIPQPVRLTRKSSVDGLPTFKVWGVDPTSRNVLVENEPAPEVSSVSRDETSSTVLKPRFNINATVPEINPVRVYKVYVRFVCSPGK